MLTWRQPTLGNVHHSDCWGVADLHVLIVSLNWRTIHFYPMVQIFYRSHKRRNNMNWEEQLLYYSLSKGIKHPYKGEWSLTSYHCNTVSFTELLLTSLMLFPLIYTYLPIIHLTNCTLIPHRIYILLVSPDL